jgi:hypothetical protein
MKKVNWFIALAVLYATASVFIGGCAKESHTMGDGGTTAPAAMPKMKAASGTEKPAAGQPNISKE